MASVLHSSPVLLASIEAIHESTYITTEYSIVQRSHILVTMILHTFTKRSRSRENKHIRGAARCTYTLFLCTGQREAS